MTSTTIFITGINSFVGSNLALYLKGQGHNIKGSLSDLGKANSVVNITNELTQIKLGAEILPLAIPDGIDVLIYAAHDKSNAVNNIESNKRIFEIAEKKGCQYHIFISSISANSDNNTDYGKVKLELEKFFEKKKNSVVVRPGLVIGEGGLYSNMKNYVKNHHLIPLPDGGRYKMAVIEMAELSEAIKVLIQERPSGFFNLYQPQLISLKEIVKNIARLQDRKIFIIKIPIDFTLFFFSFFKSILNLLKINNKFNLDSVSGYKLYKNLKLPPSDLGKLKKVKDQ